MNTTNGIFAFAKNSHSKIYNNIFLDIWRQLDFGYPFQFFQQNLYDNIDLTTLEIDGIYSYLQNRYQSAKIQIDQYLSEQKKLSFQK